MIVNKGIGWTSVEVPQMKHLALPPARERDVPTVENAVAYAKLFDYFNKTLFIDLLGESLPHPVLNFSRKRGAVAFFAPKSWKDPQTGDYLDEISLVPEWTSQDPEEVCSSLVHEMAHYLDYVQGTSCKNGYHGRAWFKIMDRLGLPGKDLTGTKLKVSNDILPNGPFANAYRDMPKDIFLPFHTSQGKFATDGVIKKKTMQGRRVRYQCPVCAFERNGGGIMQGPTGMNLLCVTHNEPLHDLGVY
jgi:hypothetical protein